MKLGVPSQLLKKKKIYFAFADLDMSRSYDALVEMNSFHYFLDGLYG